MMDDEQFEQEMAKLRADNDQFMERSAEYAKSLARFFNELLRQGLERGEALKLTRDMNQQQFAAASSANTMDSLMGMMRRSRGDEGEEL